MTKVPAAQSAASAAAATTSDREQARPRRRPRSLIDRGYRYEFLEMDDDPADAAAAGPDSYAASDHGGSRQGFTGTIPKSDLDAAGLVTLAGDEFGGGPGQPLLPETWGDEPGPEARG